MEMLQGQKRGKNFIRDFLDFLTFSEKWEIWGQNWFLFINFDSLTCFDMLCYEKKTF